MIVNFLRYTGIHPETFGRLAAGDPDLFYRMRDGNYELHQETQERILDFIHNYEDAKS
jgi:hypothetical protein